MIGHVGGMPSSRFQGDGKSFVMASIGEIIPWCSTWEFYEQIEIFRTPRRDLHGLGLGSS